MKLKLITQGNPLEFNEEMDDEKLGIYYKEYFVDLLKMVDDLRDELSTVLDILSEECDTSRSAKIEDKAINLLTRICK